MTHEDIVALLDGLATSDPGPAPSDARLKTDISRTGTAPNGLPLYRYRYTGHAPVFEGVMAQDVLHHTPDAVIHAEDGTMAVDYARLGLRMKRIH